MVRRRPRYPSDSDYTTNAPSYYEDLARKQKLIKELSKRIWEYDEQLKDRLSDLETTLQSYLDKWDDRIDNLDKEVEHIFLTWLEDGTLEKIINHDVLGQKANQKDLDETNKQVAQMKGKVYNAESFGIIGDGVTDYTESINNALEYIGQQGGGILFFPDNNYYIKSNVYSRYDDVFIEGESLEKTRFLLDDIGKIQFIKKSYEDIPATNPNFTAFNNLPPFRNINYFDPIEFGGIENRLKNAGIKNVTLHKLTGSPFSLRFYKVDIAQVENVKITFENPNLTNVVGVDNPVKYYYCSFIDTINLTIDPNYDSNYGIFTYWSYGCDFKNITIGDVVTNALNFKHVVSSTVKGLYSTFRSYNTLNKGLSVGYGSQRIKIEDVYVKNGHIQLQSSPEFQYSNDIYLNNVHIDQGFIHLRNLKNSIVENVTINLRNTYSQLFAFLLTLDPYYHQYGTEETDSSYYKNTGYFTFDHNYDYKTLINYGGVSHYRYYTYLQQPSLLGVTIKNIDITVEKTASRTVTFDVFRFQGGGSIPYGDMLTNGKYKVKNNNLPISWKNVTIEDMNINYESIDSSNNTITNTFINNNMLSLVNTDIKRIYFQALKVNNLNGNADIRDSSLINLAKLINTNFEDIRFTPYSLNTETIMTIRAFDGFTVQNMRKDRSDLTGAFIQDQLSLINASITANDFTIENEVYENVLISQITIDGLRTFIRFFKTLPELEGKLKTNRFVYNNVTNSRFTHEDFTIMSVESGASTTDPVLQLLNTVNQELVV